MNQHTRDIRTQKVLIWEQYQKLRKEEKKQQKEHNKEMKQILKEK